MQMRKGLYLVKYLKKKIPKNTPNEAPKYKYLNYQQHESTKSCKFSSIVLNLRLDFLIVIYLKTYFRLMYIKIKPELKLKTVFKCFVIPTNMFRF